MGKTHMAGPNSKNPQADDRQTFGSRLGHFVLNCDWLIVSTDHSRNHSFQEPLVVDTQSDVDQN